MEYEAEGNRAQERGEVSQRVIPLTSSDLWLLIRNLNPMEYNVKVVIGLLRDEPELFHYIPCISGLPEGHRSMINTPQGAWDLVEPHYRSLREQPFDEKALHYILIKDALKIQKRRLWDASRYTLHSSSLKHAVTLEHM